MGSVSLVSALEEKGSPSPRGAAKLPPFSLGPELALTVLVHPVTLTHCKFSANICWTEVEMKYVGHPSEPLSYNCITWNIMQNSWCKSFPLAAMKEKGEILLMGKTEHSLFIFHLVRWSHTSHLPATQFQIGHTSSHYVFITQIKLRANMPIESVTLKQWVT